MQAKPTERLSPEVAAAVAVLVREGYDLTKLGVPGQAVRLTTPEQVFKALQLGIIDTEDARPLLGLPPRRGPLERVLGAIARALQVVVGATRRQLSVARPAA